ncbi:MAG: hypothetical protein ABFS32_21885, partial [Bacteroidota bacterium]
FYDGNYKAALDPLRHAFEINPKGLANWLYAWAFACDNRHEEAISVIDKGLKKDYNSTANSINLMLKFALINEKEKALKIITSDLQNAIKTGGPAISHLASGILAFCGEKEKAIDLLNNAVDRGFLNYPLIAEKDPFLENIREEKQFITLMKKLKYKWENFKV